MRQNAEKEVTHFFWGGGGGELSQAALAAAKLKGNLTTGLEDFRSFERTHSHTHSFQIYFRRPGLRRVVLDDILKRLTTKTKRIASRQPDKENVSRVNPGVKALAQQRFCMWGGHSQTVPNQFFFPSLRVFLNPWCSFVQLEPSFSPATRCPRPAWWCLTFTNIETRQRYVWFGGFPITATQVVQS